MKPRIAVVFFFLVGWSSIASADVSQLVRYVKIDHNQADVRRQTAHVYDETFNRLPDDPQNPRTSAEIFPEDQSIWILGTQVDVVRRLADGTIEVKSEENAYAKLVHHMVFAYVDGIKPQTDIGGQRPIGVGSELTDFEFPPPYAYQIRGGRLRGWDWHWHNLGGVPGSDEVYIRFTYTVDSEDAGYRDTNATWIDAVFGTAEFCIPPGEQGVYDGVPYEFKISLKAVAVIPHIHDHSSKLELVQNDEVLIDFTGTYSDQASYHISHGRCGFTGWHEHDGHINVKSLVPWTPGEDGPVFNAGDRVWSRTSFDNPHDRVIDGMGILITFWEGVK